MLGALAANTSAVPSPTPPPIANGGRQPAAPGGLAEQPQPDDGRLASGSGPLGRQHQPPLSRGQSRWAGSQQGGAGRAVPASGWAHARAPGQSLVARCFKLPASCQTALTAAHTVTPLKARARRPPLRPSTSPRTCWPRNSGAASSSAAARRAGSGACGGLCASSREAAAWVQVVRSHSVAS